MEPDNIYKKKEAQPSIHCTSNLFVFDKFRGVTVTKNSVGMNSTLFYELSQYQKTNEFKEKYKKRASIEGKNAELKRYYGLSQEARGYGLLAWPNNQN
jgi:hypothetical protein